MASPTRAPVGADGRCSKSGSQATVSDDQNNSSSSSSSSSYSWSSSSSCWEIGGSRVYLWLGMLFTVLALSCLILYSSTTNTLAFYPTSYLDSVSSSSAGRNIYMLEAVLRSAAMEDNKTVILTTLNDAWAEPDSLFDLFLESFRIGNGTLKLLDHLIVVALDSNSYRRCLAVHSHCFALTTAGIDFSGQADFMTSDYLKMMWRRIDFLRAVLQKGYDFVFTDADIMWLRNPFPQFYRDADFQIACDSYNFGPGDKRNSPNGGFAYARSNERTIEFYKFWYRSRRSFPGRHDQDVLNKIKSDHYLSDIGLQMRFLDTAIISGFCQLSGDLDRVCTVHANCCVGLDNKINDLSVVLEDWKKYKANNGTGGLSGPKDCVGSLDRPPKPHKRHKHGLPGRRG